jgi:antitoxin VapB
MYTMYMALHITNPEVEEKVRALASTTGESITEAIGAAADERLARVKSVRRMSPPATIDEILALMRSFDLQPINTDLTDDDILGYGPNGYSE